jgi:hypothetical protein
MITAALLALSLGQSIPERANVLYTGIPIQLSGEASMVTHSTTVEVDKTTAKYSSLTTLRNGNAKATTVVLRVPVLGNQVTWTQKSGAKLSVQINNKEVETNLVTKSYTEPDAKGQKSGVIAGLFVENYQVSFELKPKETKSVKINFSTPLGIAGLDGVQRMVTYDTAGAGTWVGSVGQFNYAIKYPENLIVQVFAALPEGKWEVGPKGAFWKAYNFTPAKKSLLIFTYYPNTLD